MKRKDEEKRENKKQRGEDEKQNTNECLQVVVCKERQCLLQGAGDILPLSFAHANIHHQNSYSPDQLSILLSFVYFKQKLKTFGLCVCLGACLCVYTVMGDVFPLCSLALLLDQWNR